MKIGTITPYKARTPMFSGANFLLRINKDRSPKEIKEEQDTFEKEVSQTKKARQAGVIVPEYKPKFDDDGNVVQIKYQTKGDIPDIKTNPLRSKHFSSLFTNLYYLDAAGIFHNDLDPSHIFLSNDGKVEFDCFRYSVNFRKDFEGGILGNDGSIRTPDFMLPSNERLFEEQFLGGYLSKMEEDDKPSFIRNYLFNRSRYHQKREALLLKRRFYPDNKTVRFETVQTNVFLNPSHRVVNYEIDKLDTLGLKRRAFTEWDEGGGACGHEISPKRRFDAILLNLDCILKTMNVKEEAAHFADNALDSNEREFFAFEKEIMSKQLSDLIHDTKGMGSWNFNDTEHNIFIGTKDEKQFFEELFDGVDVSNPSNARDAIFDIKEYYSYLKDRWNEDFNTLFMEDC